MKISILESYNDHNYSLIVSSFVKKEFCDFVSEFGYDETKRTTSHIGSEICIFVNGHSMIDNPEVFIRPRGIYLKNKSIVEYFISLPVENIKNSNCKIETWILFMLRALKLIEEKSGVKFKILQAKNQAVKDLKKKFKSNDIYKNDLSARDPDSPSVNVL